MSQRFLPDVNAWFALCRSEHQYHEASHAWLSAVLDAESIAFTRVTQQGLLRLLTTDTVMRNYASRALTNQEAWNIWKTWTKDERIHWLDETPGLVDPWQRLGAVRSASPKLWMDAYLAALAMTSGYRLVTLDRAFLSFKGLDTEVIA